MKEDVIVSIWNERQARSKLENLSHGAAGTRIALFSGPVGLGKTTIDHHLCLEHDGVWIEALPDWTAAWMLRDIAGELGAQRARSSESNFRAIVGALQMRPRPLFIDEADRLARKLSLAETLRAIHDATTNPLVLIGMRDFPRAVRALPQLESRVSAWVEFRPCDFRDTKLLASELCEGVTLEDDLIKQVQQITNGTVRSIKIALDRIESFANRRGKKKVALSDLPEDSDVFYVLVRKPSLPEGIGAGKHVYQVQVDGSIKRLQ